MTDKPKPEDSKVEPSARQDPLAPPPPGGDQPATEAPKTVRLVGPTDAKIQTDEQTAERLREQGWK